MKIICDKHGREYFVIESDCDSEQFRRFNIKSGRCQVGYLNYSFEGDGVLHLDDLHIEDAAISPPWFFLDFIFIGGSFPPLRWRTKNFRGCGIGTAMIEYLVNYARVNSITRIEGEVKPHDFKDNPDLPEWYRRRGFTVTAGDEKAAWIAKISLTVSK